jgi:hypothetical protein
MGLKTVSLDSLSELDNGRVAKAAAKHFARAGADCYDRPADPKERVITLEIALSPKTGQDGLCTGISARCKVKSKVPEHVSGTMSFAVGANGALLFNPDSPENVDQSTLLADDD